MLKKYMINLQRRDDRLNKYDISELNIEVVRAYDGQQMDRQQIETAPARPNWRDPFNNRRMTKGEIGCFYSHMMCWEKVAAGNEPALILEDDVVFTEYYNELLALSELDKHEGDLLLLGHNENLPDKAFKLNQHTVVPGFPYNTHAYLLRPEGAKKLLDLTLAESFSMIPLDDWFSEQLDAGTLSILASQPQQAIQATRDSLGTDVEPSSSGWLDNWEIHVLTCATDNDKAFRLYDSANKYKINVINVGHNVPWSGTDMSGPGGGQKINLINNYLQHVPDTDLVMFVDGYDVFFCNGLEEIIDRYLSFNKRVVFGAEKICWPDTGLEEAFPKVHTEYRYLNSGTFIGEAGTLKRLLSGTIANHEDDQLFIQKKYLSGVFDIGLDVEQYLFHTYDPCMTTLDWQPYNPETNCCGCVFHGNGGPQAKAKLDELYNQLFPNVSGFVTPQMPIKLERDMIEVEFATREWCNKVIEAAERHGGWEPLPGDLFPAQEIRVTELDIYDELEEFWNSKIVPIVEKEWYPMRMYGIRDAFVMKYTPDTQNKLSLHTDASLVTGSIKLNDDYSGGSLVFPRQGITNDDTPVGKCILFPGMCTHGHECKEVTKGTKYSLTIWSSRYEGDVQL